MRCMDASDSLFSGKLVRLAAYASDDNAIIAHWSENPEFLRLVDTDVARPLSEEQVTERYNRMSGPSNFYFSLRTLDDDRLIGFVALHSIEWNNGVSALSIGIGDPQDWGKGFGSDALQIILRYAFTELNLHRVGLDVISYNARAIRAYEKAGFRHEGERREMVHREGARHSVIVMGILRPEWEAQQAKTKRKRQQKTGTA